MMMNMPKVEKGKKTKDRYNNKEMVQSFQKENEKAKRFDAKFAEEMKGIDCKTVLEEEGEVNYVYSHMENAMKETANAIWPMKKKTNRREEESGEVIKRKSELKHLWWKEWTNSRMDVVRNCSVIRKEVESRSI